MNYSKVIKNILYDLGADLCGIAPIERFENAPEGFHPNDIYSECKSVVVFAKKAPTACMFSNNRVVYSKVTASIFVELDRICVNACCHLEKFQINAVMIPPDSPYEYWDNEKQHGKGILSLKHAGELAGIGVIGKNTLLVNKDFGNLMYLGALLIDKVVEYDPIITKNYCSDNCNICIQNCPMNAINGIAVNQLLCRSHAAVQTTKGYWLYNCSKCRTLCPNSLGHK